MNLSYCSKQVLYGLPTHRIIKWLGLEGTPGIIRFQLPATGRDTNLQIWYLTRLPRAPSWATWSLSSSFLVRRITYLSLRNCVLPTDKSQSYRKSEKTNSENQEEKTDVRGSKQAVSLVAFCLILYLLQALRHGSSL